MASALQHYHQLANYMATQITASFQNWTDFLTTAARLYKYPYHEQLMIYAQRPDATACAEYDLWNKRMGRYIRLGAKGIALIDQSGDSPRLRYVFDVADTGGTERSRSPYFWEYRPEHEQVVSHALEQQYNIQYTGDFTDQLEQISSAKVTEYFLAHQQDILDIVDGSHLEEYHDYDKGVAFLNAAAVSTTYMLLSRCGLAENAHFGPEDFMPVFDFNTPQTVDALGSAVSGISEEILRNIEVTIKRYEREKLSERSQNHERTDLHPQRGLLDSRSEPVPAGGGKPLGKYGRMRKKYLQEYRPVLWNRLILSEQLYPHLWEIDEAANSRLEQMMPELMKSAGVTEALKASDPMKWVGLMNNLKAQAEEVILTELVYA